MFTIVGDIAVIPCLNLFHEGNAAIMVEEYLVSNQNLRIFFSFDVQ